MSCQWFIQIFGYKILLWSTTENHKRESRTLKKIMLYDVQITSLSSTDVTMFNYLRKLTLVEKKWKF